MDKQRRNRLGLGMLDQCLSGASNIVALFAIALVAEVDEFGVTSFALVIAMAAVVLSRGVFGTFLTLLSGSPARLRIETGFAVTTAALSGCVIAALFAAVGLTSTTRGLDLLLIGVAIPALLVQDTGRHACVAMGRPGYAVISDGMWAAGSLALFVTATLRPGLPTSLIVAGWVLLAFASAIALVALIGARPRLRGLASWIAVDRADRTRYSADAAVSAANGVLPLTITGVLVGAAAIASLRGAGTIMGPLNIVMAYIPLVLVAELRRDSALRPSSYWAMMGRTASGLSLIALAVGIGSIWIPDHFGVKLLGSTWRVAQPLLPITAIEYCGLAWGIAAQSVLRARADSKSLLASRVLHFAMIVAMTSAMAMVFETALSIAIGLAIAAWSSAAFALLRSVRPSDKTNGVAS